MKTCQYLITCIFFLTVNFSCHKKTAIIEPPAVAEWQGSDFTCEFNENPRKGQVIGTITAQGPGGEPLDYMSLRGTGICSKAGDVFLVDDAGKVSVKDSSYFDFEKNNAMSGILIICEKGNTENRTTIHFTINLKDVNEVEIMTVQKRLNKSETPKQIYASDHLLLDSLYGKHYLGGLIFYFDVQLGSGMVAAPVDQSAGIEWAPQGTSKMMYATAQAIGGGYHNTKFAIYTQVIDHAPLICQKYFNINNEWVLPCYDEMEEMYRRLHSKGLGGFSNSKYWTSTEVSATQSYARDLSVSGDAAFTQQLKSAQYKVRAIKYFE